MTKEKVIDFLVLSLRWYLIFYMINYGWSKLTMSQFGVYDDAILDASLRDADVFYLAWHLYGESHFFNYVTGLAEIVGGILLMFNRTVLLGVLLVLTILGQILIIDISFTMGQHGYALPLRITGMITAALLILYYYKDKVIAAYQVLTQNITTKLKYPWWVYLLLPIIGFLFDFIFALLTMPLKMLLNAIAPIS